MYDVSVDMVKRRCSVNVLCDPEEDDLAARVFEQKVVERGLDLGQSRLREFGRIQGGVAKRPQYFSSGPS